MDTAISSPQFQRAATGIQLPAQFVFTKSAGRCHRKIRTDSAISSMGVEFGGKAVWKMQVEIPIACAEAGAARLRTRRYVNVHIAVAGVQIQVIKASAHFEIAIARAGIERAIEAGQVDIAVTGDNV